MNIKINRLRDKLFSKEFRVEIGNKKGNKYWIPIVQNMDNIKIKKIIGRIDMIIPVLLCEESTLANEIFMNLLPQIIRDVKRDNYSLLYCYTKYPGQFSRKLETLLKELIIQQVHIFISFIGEDKYKVELKNILSKLI